MPSPDAKDGPTKDVAAALPDGHSAVPIGAAETASAVRVCVVVRRGADGKGAQPVVLRDTLEARVYWGCVADAGGGVVKWLELWAQNPATLAGSISQRRGQVTNTHVDRRWQRVIKAWERTPGTALVRLGRESAPQPATFINAASLEPVHPTEAASGTPLVLCRDEALLAGAGLPSYANTAHRYLHHPGGGAAGPFVPLTPDAPTSQATRPLADFLPKGVDLAPFNAAAGQLIARPHAPLSFAEYVDVLSSDNRDGIDAAGGVARGAAAPHASSNGGGWLMLAQAGQSGRLVETLHLKLRALADAVEAVAEAVRLLQLPLLNLTDESFRVEIGPEARGLPSLWTARARLVDTGDTLEWSLPGADARYYLPARPGVASIYRPTLGQPVQARASVRVRQVHPGTTPNTVVLEGTLVSQERLEAAGRDLVWFRMNVGGTVLDVYARLEKAAALAAGEWRFKSVPLSPPAAVLTALRAEAGIQSNDVPFEHLPLLATPCDLYSLGVLAVRTLLVNGRTSLPVALDEALSLARQVAAEQNRAAPLGKRVARVLAQDKRWLESLGPHRLTNETLSPQQAFEMVPADVWCDVLAFVVRLFPGAGPDSHAKDLGDAPPEGLHAVFAGPLEELDALLLRTRSLIVIDWKFNREVNSAIRAAAQKWATEPGAVRGAGAT